MSHVDVFLIGAMRAVVEVALLALLGQGVLALLAGAGRANNPIYRLFRIVTAPALKAARHVTPRRVMDKHLPFVAFLLLFWLWLALAWIKRSLCQINGLVC